MNKTVRLSLIVLITVGLLMALTISGLAKKPDTFHLEYVFPEVNWEIFYAEGTFDLYLLRLWRVKEDGEDWRATLEDVVTGELRGFTDLGALMAYLKELDAIKLGEGVLAAQEPGEGRG
jgi:hypothetical protein